MKHINIDYIQGKEYIMEQFTRFDLKTNERQLHSYLRIKAKLIEKPIYLEFYQKQRIIHTFFCAQTFFVERNNFLLECVQN